MNTPLFSIIVPVYKIREAYLKACLESISNQSFRDFEAILIDDGSPDDSGERCDRFALTDDRFRVIHTPNGGVASARNRGLEEARGQWVWMVDADDWVEENALEILSEEVRGDDTLDALQFHSFRDYPDGREERDPLFSECDRIVGNSDEEKRRLLADILEPPYFARKAPRGTHCFFLTDKIFRREVFVTNGLILQKGIRMNEDQEFFFRFVPHCRSLRRVDAYLYHYRRTGENVTARYNDWMADNSLVLFARLAALAAEADAMYSAPKGKDGRTAFERGLDHRILLTASQTLLQQFYHPLHPQHHRWREARAFLKNGQIRLAMRRTSLSELQRLNAVRVFLMRLGAYEVLVALIRFSHRRSGNI